MKTYLSRTFVRQLGSSKRDMGIIWRAYIYKPEWFQINNLTMCHTLETQDKPNSELTDGKNNKETKRTRQRTNQTQSWFFEKINKRAGEMVHLLHKCENLSSNPQKWCKCWMQSDGLCPPSTPAERWRKTRNTPPHTPAACGPPTLVYAGEK